MKLQRQYVEKPWGRTELPPMFDAPKDQRIGEVWFTGGADLPLLAKYIFTSERLSVQVHPDDEQARARGLPHGKTECWYILEADPGSTLGLGLKREVSAEELRSAALDGSIEGLLDWRTVQPGDFFLVPPGTIHAIGGGLSLIEFQQNADVTYRLYDYGRPRELHLDDAVDVACRAPYRESWRSMFPPMTSARWWIVRSSNFVYSRQGCPPRSPALGDPARRHGAFGERFRRPRRLSAGRSGRTDRM